MARAIWKGAISFGLVHIPVALVSATTSTSVDFDWLDKRSMDPVGYKRINKVTGKEVTSENIVKGVAYEKDRYVVLSEEEIRSAHPKSTQTIDIFAFVDSQQIPLQNIDTPYFLTPTSAARKSMRCYAKPWWTPKGRAGQCCAAYPRTPRGGHATGIGAGDGDPALACRRA